MPVSIDKQVKHWDATWRKRITPEDIEMNGGKFNMLMNWLWNLPLIVKKEKLDVGCGPALHSHLLAEKLIGWRETWTGIDLSPVAVAHAQKRGLNAVQGNFLEWRGDKKFDVFMFLDTLEHFEDLDAVSIHVRANAQDHIPYVIGNVPLYLSPTDNETGGVELYVNPKIIKQFVFRCGCTAFETRIYGINDMPYMIFEGYDPKKKQEDMRQCFSIPAKS